MTETVLQEAQRIVDGQRKAKYGPPEVNHAATADFFRVWVKRRYGTDVAFDSRDVCMFNILQKCSREAHVHDRDNMVDIPGYCRNVEIVMATATKNGEMLSGTEEVTGPNWSRTGGEIPEPICVGDVVAHRDGTQGRVVEVMYDPLSYRVALDHGVLSVWSPSYVTFVRRPAQGKPNPVPIAIKIGDIVRLRPGVVGRSLDDRDLRVDLVVSDGFGGSVLHVSTAQGHTAVVPPSAVESILSKVSA